MAPRRPLLDRRRQSGLPCCCALRPILLSRPPINGARKPRLLRSCAEHTTATDRAPRAIKALEVLRTWDLTRRRKGAKMAQKRSAQKLRCFSLSRRRAHRAACLPARAPGTAAGCICLADSKPAADMYTKLVLLCATQQPGRAQSRAARLARHAACISTHAAPADSVPSPARSQAVLAPPDGPALAPAARAAGPLGAAAPGAAGATGTAVAPGGACAAPAAPATAAAPARASDGPGGGAPGTAPACACALRPGLRLSPGGGHALSHAGMHCTARASVTLPHTFPCHAKAARMSHLHAGTLSRARISGLVRASAMGQAVHRTGPALEQEGAPRMHIIHA